MTRKYAAAVRRQVFFVRFFARLRTKSQTRRLFSRSNGILSTLFPFTHGGSYVHAPIRSRCALPFRPMPQQGPRSPLETRHLASLFHPACRRSTRTPRQSLHSRRNRPMDKTALSQTFQVFAIWQDQRGIKVSLIFSQGKHSGNA